MHNSIGVFDSITNIASQNGDESEYTGSFSIVAKAENGDDPRGFNYDHVTGNIEYVTTQEEPSSGTEKISYYFSKNEDCSEPRNHVACGAVSSVQNALNNALTAEEIQNLQHIISDSTQKEKYTGRRD